MKKIDKQHPESTAQALPANKAAIERLTRPAERVSDLIERVLPRGRSPALTQLDPKRFQLKKIH